MLKINLRSTFIACFIVVFGAGNPDLFRVGEECALLKNIIAKNI